MKDRWKIHDTLVKNLQENGFHSFFPVQVDVIPTIINQSCERCVIPQDICVSAATGSGKTLAYALPVLNTLIREPPGKLQALVLLPSRDLASQVYSVFTRLAADTKITITLATGQRDFEGEKHLLMGPQSSFADDSYGGVGEVFSNQHIYTAAFDAATDAGIGRCNTDILIATAGRLLDHLQSTPGFTLQHLRFLVLDEADRLLGNAYHGWVRQLINSTAPERFHLKQADSSSIITPMFLGDGRRHANLDSGESLGSTPSWMSGVARSRRTAAAEALQNIIAPISGHAGLGFFLPRPSGSSSATAYSASSSVSGAVANWRPSLQRLLFSATLTDNPSKLSLLGIYAPLLIRSGRAIDTASAQSTTPADANLQDNEGYREDGKVEVEVSAAEVASTMPGFDGTARFMLPAKLTESRVLCDAASKPLQLISLLMEAFTAYRQNISVNDHVTGSSGISSVNDDGVGRVDTVPVGIRCLPAGTAVVGTAAVAVAVTAESSSSHRSRCAQQDAMCIIFTSSVEETHRLCKLLELVNGQFNSAHTKHSSIKAKGIIGKDAIISLRSTLVQIRSDFGSSETTNSTVDSLNHGSIVNAADNTNSSFTHENENNKKKKQKRSSEGTTTTAATTTGDGGAGDSSYLFGGEVVEMSRIVKAADREKVIADATAGKISILVSSDQMARGIDLPNIKLVINYEPPKYAKTYVHRVGRTARAHESGHCVTFVNVGQLGSFQKLRRDIAGAEDKDGFNKCVRKARVHRNTTDQLKLLYEKAIQQLPHVL